MIVKLLTEHHLELLSLKGGCTGFSESIHVKMPHCWKSHALAHLYLFRSPDEDSKLFIGMYCRPLGGLMRESRGGTEGPERPPWKNTNK